jgi:cAMP-specific phosphodiesterase 4
LSVLQKKYNKRNNPFHNYDHGIAVMQSAHYMLLCGKARQMIDDFRRMSTIISGLCHDVDHTGRTNIFMINSQSKLATRYHDSSVKYYNIHSLLSNIMQQLQFLC